MYRSSRPLVQLSWCMYFMFHIQGKGNTCTFIQQKLNEIIFVYFFFSRMLYLMGFDKKGIEIHSVAQHQQGRVCSLVSEAKGTSWRS